MRRSREIVYLPHEKYQSGGNWYFWNWVSDENKLIKWGFLHSPAMQEVA